jgi:hypothetical protein
LLQVLLSHAQLLLETFDLGLELGYLRLQGYYLGFKVSLISVESRDLVSGIRELLILLRKLFFPAFNIFQQL